jgi:hypothetical protein
MPSPPANDLTFTPSRSGNMADPNQASMPNRLMIRNLAGPATARCRIELDDLGMPTD